MTIFYLYLKLVYNLILSCLSTDSAATDNRIPKFNLSFEYLKYLFLYLLGTLFQGKLPFKRCARAPCQ